MLTFQVLFNYQQNHEVRKCHGFIMKQLKEKCANNKTRLLTHTHTHTHTRTRARTHTHLMFNDCIISYRRETLALIRLV